MDGTIAVASIAAGATIISSGLGAWGAVTLKKADIARAEADAAATRAEAEAEHQARIAARHKAEAEELAARQGVLDRRTTAQLDRYAAEIERMQSIIDRLRDRVQNQAPKEAP